MPVRYLAFFLLILLPPCVQAQRPMPLPRLTGPVTLDGLSDEPAWQAVDPLPLTMYRPVFQDPPTERTEIRIAYDDAYLYVAGRLYDSDPSGIRSNSLYRDRYSGDDLLALILDTFNDRENALFFHINPAGVRVDMALSNDAQGDFLDVANFDWNTFWDTATLQNDEGWFAEMRIPFSSLGFQDADARVIMGLIAYRYIARKDEVQVFPAISPEQHFYAPSQGRRVVLRGVHSQTPLYVTPYALGGIDQISEPASDSKTASFTEEIGLDAKYNLTSNLTLDLTINTDFAQVEADDQQINLTRFSLFFPEKRPFFQERASIFDFRTGFQERLFHSRRIGLSEDGRPIPILGGVRMVGRRGTWDVGLLDMQTARQDTIPSENFGVLRLRRRAFNPYSYAGAMLTSRLGLDGSYNVAYGLDGLFRVTGDEYLTLQWVQTFDDAEIRRGGFDFLASSLARLRWERRQQQGWSYFGDVTRAGKAYRPDMGFFLRQNFVKFAGRLGYERLLGPRASLRSIAPQASGLLVLRGEDGTVESGFLEHAWTWTWKSGAALSLSAQASVEDLRGPLLLPEHATVPPGTYDFYRLGASYTMPVGQLFRTGLQASAGTFYDGRDAEIRLDPTWNVSPHLELGASYQLNVVRFPKRNQAFEAHVGRLRLQAALNTSASVSAFVQYNSASDLIAANVRFRYNFREGHDLWVVYNEGRSTNRLAGDPHQSLIDRRALLVKYTHTFVR